MLLVRITSCENTGQNVRFMQNNKATDIFIHYKLCQSNLIPVLKCCVVHVCINYERSAKSFVSPLGTPFL